MLSIAELNGLKTQIESRQQIRAISVLSPEQALALVNQAIDDRKTINRWFGFLKLMASRSSWRDAINDLLDSYLYGTEDKSVQLAAQRYNKLAALHDRSINK